MDAQERAKRAAEEDAKRAEQMRRELEVRLEKAELKAKRDAERILQEARTCSAECAKRILIKGNMTVTEGAAAVFAGAKIKLLGNESQTVGPIGAPGNVHRILLGADLILLEGLRLGEVPVGSHLLNAAPLNLGGADGAPCRAVLLDLE